MISDPIETGEQFGNFVLRNRIGNGGNGQVWRATGPDGDIALKLLTKIKTVAYARFKDEGKDAGKDARRFIYYHLIKHSY